MQRALNRSRLLLVFASPRFFSSETNRMEVKTFMNRAETTGKNLILPVVLSGAQSFPASFLQYQYYDFSDYAFVGEGFEKSIRYLEFQEKIRDMSNQIVKMLKNVPEFNREWTTATREEANASLEISPPTMPSL